MGLRIAHASDMPRGVACLRVQVRVRSVEISNTTPARGAVALFRIGTAAVLHR
ncbi:hypothetical protein [Burkholderia sp. BCC0405]|uniref:hypothetical protein n=1 Tax=Burkholderia sp. BCC0405 TaxID=2676298 RepID=UPI001FC7F351|nr:hypothetical protein [Burkholderia sp. BCC0405]